MNEDQITELLKNYSEAKLSQEQKSKLESWYINYGNQSNAVMDNHEVSKSLKQLRASLGIKERKPVLKLWPYISIASCILLALCLYLYIDLSQDHINKVNLADVSPGKNGATLTLDNGKKIILSATASGELAQEGNIKIIEKNGHLIYQFQNLSEQQHKFNTLSTVPGQTYVVILPDQSKVWLNSASSLRYPASFASLKNRTVELQGEAYFEIAKDAKHPFIVKTGTQSVQVLGTHFNINSYTDEQAITTTLLEGLVRISSGKTERVLKVGEQAVNKNNQVSISKVNTDNITDWVNGDFYFDNMDFRAAMRKIGRWYDLDIVYDRSLPVDIEAGGWISRNNKLSTVLHLIEKSGQVHFKVEGKKLYITR